MKKIIKIDKGKKLVKDLNSKPSFLGVKRKDSLFTA